jgi:hypothetical protein
MRARFRHLWLVVREVIGGRLRRIGRSAYCRIRGNRLIALMWRPAIIKIRLTAGDGVMVKFVCRQRTVGAHRWGEEGLVCRKPFDLLLHRPCRCRTVSSLNR